jgi:GT2 family glycosyltransferase
MPSVGVVIVNWNSFEELKNCLSALAAVKGHITHTVVIDNHSDNAPTTLPGPHSEPIDYIQLDSNTGFARGNNLALTYLEDCDWVAFVNPDAYVDTGWLESMLYATVRYPDCAMFASCLLKANEPEIFDGVGDYYNLSGVAWRMGHGLPRMDSIEDKEVFAPCAAAALYRRDALVAVGGFDEDFFCYFEDVDLAFRLRLAGYKCMLVSKAIAYHVGSATTGGEKINFSVYHGHRNMVWCYLKNMPGILFWILLPLHLAINIALVIRFILCGQGWVIVRAKWDAIKGISRMWSKRRTIQASRLASNGEIWRVLYKSLLPKRD